ncbi:hypothetical protein A8B73_20160 [Methylosinus sp. 3S-1]|nr:hypothetical protein A8B73_20160 [Methylosinus sp. 3S-1]
MTMTEAEKLADAEAALHKLLTTGGVVEVTHNGKTVKYARANIGELKAYVAQLRGGRINSVRVTSSKGL